MTLLIHRHNPPSGFATSRWQVRTLWVRVLEKIRDGEDTPAKLFGVEGDGSTSQMQFNMAGQVLRDMLDSGCILWEDERRLRLIVCQVGRDVMEWENFVTIEGEYILEWGDGWAWNGTNGLGDGDAEL